MNGLAPSDIGKFVGPRDQKMVVHGRFETAFRPRGTWRGSSSFIHHTT